MKYLFIGGPRDGERINVEEQLSKVRVLAMPEEMFSEIDPSIPLVKEGFFLTSIYRRFELQVNNIVFTLYAFDSLRDEHVVDMLLDSYSPKQPEPMKLKYQAELDAINKRPTP